MKQGRGGLFKWLSKAEFSLCDAPGVAGGRPCGVPLCSWICHQHCTTCCTGPREGDIEDITSYDILHFWCRYCTHICYLIITVLFTISNLRTCEVAIRYWGHIFFSCSWILLLLPRVGYVTMIVSFDALRACSWICQWANVGGGGLWFTYRGHKHNLVLLCFFFVFRSFLWNVALFLNYSS